MIGKSTAGTIATLLAIFCGAFICGCNSDTYCLEGSSTHSDTPLPLAHAVSNVSCTETPRPPSLEVWAGAADSVVIGTVKRVCPHKEPAYIPRSDAEPPYVSETDCTGFIEAGMAIELSDVETLYGKDTGGELTVTLGASVVQDYVPMPFAWNGGPITWAPPGQPGRIKPGQRIGGAMHRDPDWDLLGPQKAGVFFQVDTSDYVRFQGYGNEYCYSLVPVGVDGIALEELRSKLSSLDISDPVVQQEIESRRAWHDEPLSRLSNFWGAKCFPAPECNGNDDCPGSEVCSDGFCINECSTNMDCGASELCIDGECVEV